MTTASFAMFLAEAGVLLTLMLLARRYALQHVPPCCLPPWVRLREQRRDRMCRLAMAPAIVATAAGVLLVLIT